MRKECEKLGVEVALSEVWEKGGKGGLELAEKVVKVIKTDKSDFQFLYDLDDLIRDKIQTISQKIYGADGVIYSKKAEKKISKFAELGYDNLPVCMAKTQNSISDNPALKGRPENFKVNVRDVKLSAGAEFIVVLTGPVLTMPGLPAIPSAEDIDIDENGKITGLF